MNRSNIARKPLFWIATALYCLVFPIFTLEIILGRYLTYSSLNLSLTWLVFLAHIDLTVYLIYRHITKARGHR